MELRQPDAARGTHGGDRWDARDHFADLTLANDRFLMGQELRLFLMVGVCGGCTTFSSFSLQTLALIEAGDWPRAAANVLASLILCLAAVWLGQATGPAIRAG